MSMDAVTTSLDRWRFARFLGAGLLNTGFGYAAYAALVWSGLSALAALLLATVAGVVFNFFTFGRLVFTRGNGSRAFPKFLAAYAATYSFNAALLHLATDAAGLNAYLAQALCIPPTVVLTWLLLNRWVFRSDRRPSCDPK